MPGRWMFDIPPEAAVVTTSFVTEGRMPILYVTHETDDESGVLWQLHCGNDDYSEAVLRLVRMDEMLKIDGSIAELAGLPLGFCARRRTAGEPWVIEPENATVR